MDEEAPNFWGRYPNCGVRVGPAWRMAWALLGCGQWLRGMALARVVAAACGLKITTVANLLHAAAKHGLIEKASRRTSEQGRGSGLLVAWYRRSAP